MATMVFRYNNIKSRDTKKLEVIRLCRSDDDVLHDILIFFFLTIKNMRPNTFIICLVIVTATITSTTNLFAQDIDTSTGMKLLNWQTPLFRESLDTIYLLEDEYTSGSHTEQVLKLLVLVVFPMSINLNKTLKDINKGHYGINITGMFSPATLYERAL